MAHHITKKTVFRATFALTMLILIAACGGGSIDDSTPQQTIDGSVGDGPISNALITVEDANGNIIFITTGNDQAHYTFSIPTDAPRPLIITATGGIDMVSNATPDFTLVTVVTNTEDQTANLSPFSTFVVNIAKILPGGLNEANIATAKTQVLTQLNFGFDPTVIPDPISTPVDLDNIAYIVKSSEALAEMIRRTQKEMSTTESPLNHNQVIELISRDLSDGKIDGEGIGETSPKLAAITNVISGQVLLETLRNELNVGNVNATTAMDNAIRTVFPASTMTTASVPITEQMLAQTKLILRAAQSVNTGNPLITLYQQVKKINPGSTSAQVDATLGANSGDTIASVLQTIGIDANKIERMNKAVRQDNNVTENTAPIISGAPIETLLIESDYYFKPSANDANGDDLTFTIENMPSWATFNTDTGELSGSPILEDAGITENIQISVTDGTNTTPLTSFNIAVTLPNNPPVITGSPETIAVTKKIYRYLPTASDLDNDDLTFSITGKPSWTTFNISTGELTGEPSFDDEGITENIQISVDDGTDTTQLTVFSITVIRNTPPTITNTPSTIAFVNASYYFKPGTTDADEDNLSFSIINQPSWASFDSTSGELSGTPSFTALGSTDNIEISVNDPYFTASLPTFSLSVIENSPPIIDGIPTPKALINKLYQFTPIIQDTDSSTFTFDIEGKPEWARFNDTTGKLSGTPTINDVDTTSSISIRVSDGINIVELPPFNLTVAQNNAPTLSGTPTTRIFIENAYYFKPEAFDLDDDNLSFSINNQPNWANFTPSTGELNGTPSASDEGVYANIEITVTDGSLSTSLPFSITVVKNNVPTLNGTPETNLLAGETYLFTPIANDIDDDTLTFNISGKPLWADFDNATGVLSGSPTLANLGTTSEIQISVTDGSAIALLPTFSITVDQNRAPTINGNPTTRVLTGSSYAFTPDATDLDGDDLSFSIANQPSWANFAADTGSLSGTPITGDEDIYLGIEITVTDGSLSASLSFGITVVKNNVPTLNGAPETSLLAGETYLFTPIANDIDDDTLTFNISGKPLWANFDNTTGTLSGSPTLANLGTTSEIQISVTDGSAITLLPTFSVTVGQNRAPTISGSPTTRVLAGSSYNFTPDAADLDGDDLSFSIVNQPGWANFTTKTGNLSGTPIVGDEAIYTDIEITVTDGSLSASLPFTITVEKNNAPTISGIPETTILANENYLFTPVANDIDNDGLTFYISGKPVWANFNSSTGALTGSPDIGHLGTTQDIQIMVTDGLSITPLPKFSITVDQNRAPLLSGNPTSNVFVGSIYAFTPNASDLDGDDLNFSIVNQPSWATFAADTGNLSGTPAAGDENVYSDIEITVTDGTLSTSLSFSITVVKNNPPTLSGTPDTTILIGETYLFAPQANDIDNDTLTFNISGKPLWANFDYNTGVLSGTPSLTDLGSTSDIQISVNDGTNIASISNFNITVYQNRAPILSGTPATSVLVGANYLFTPQTQDLDGDSLSFSIINQPNWTTFNSSTGMLNGTPIEIHEGSFPDIQITVTDGTLTASLTFTITVIKNNPPTLSGSPETTALVGDVYRYTPVANDIDNNPLTFHIIGKPNWASFNTNTGELSGTPILANLGVTPDIQISVSDGIVIVSQATFSLTVYQNKPPVLSGTPATSVFAKSAYYFKPSATDPDDDNLIFSIENQPSWASFNTGTGELAGTPTENNEGIFPNINISVTDGSLIASLSFSITVTKNNPPTFSGSPSTSVFVDSTYQFSPTATDLDNDSLTFSINSNKPNWANFDTNTGELTGKPSIGDVGITSNIQISVSDGITIVSLSAFSITVKKNNAPTITGSPATTILVNSNYSFSPTAKDIDGDALTFSINKKPGWASFNSTTGKLTGTPLASDQGTKNGIIISVTDGELTAALNAFSITVKKNNVPSISGTPETTARVNVPYNFAPSADDIDGDALTFSINNKPSWANFNSNTGALSGTPTTKSTTANITISVSDGITIVSLSAFSITVKENSAPTITGSPVTTILVNSNYSFVPTANDIDGDALTFSINQKPSWASFNIQTGELTGIPSSVETIENIIISVSDNTNIISLPTFSINVIQESGGPIVISNTSPNNYVWGKLTVNTPLFIDQVFTYTSIPANCIDAIALRTADSDKNTTGNNFINFDVNQEVSVYVAYDKRIVGSPSWLSTWDHIQPHLFDSSPSHSRHLFRKSFQAGRVTLGGNEGIGENQSMYTVFVTAPDIICVTATNALPIAKNDFSNTEPATPVIISVLNNDRGLEDEPIQVEVFDSPTEGEASVLIDNSIQYTPYGTYVGTDTFIYQVTDIHGDMATATVEILIECASCTTNTTLQFRWDPNPLDENITGYRLYFGDSPNTVNTLFKALTSTDINLNAPSINVNAENELMLKTGDTLCVQLSAYNNVGESNKTAATCITL